MPWTDTDIRNLIQDENAAETLVRVAEEIGVRLAKQEQMTTSQIRNIFGEARKIQANWRVGGGSRRTDLILLKPKMVYQAARHKPGGVLKDSLATAIDAVIDGSPSTEQELKRFRNFMNFFEAIVAYHKANGGKD